MPHGLLGLLLLALLAAPPRRRTIPRNRCTSPGTSAPRARRSRPAPVAQPDIAAHWYNLGATDYRLGAATTASAEWVRALRLAPRSGTIRQALQLTPPPDPVSAGRLWTAWVTPAELALAAILLWLAAWTGLLLRPLRATRWSWAGGVALLLGSAALWLQHRYREPVGVVRQSVPLRVSPHGRGVGRRHAERGTGGDDAARTAGLEPGP